jgi:superfamily I DNA/RNA helicase
VFSQFLFRIDFDIDSCNAMKEAYEVFFKKAQSHASANDEGMPADVNSFRRLFSHPSGVVVSTCHGVKGEEYDTVIAFGLLRGYVPNWAAIIHETAQVALDRESKLLYVVCSRAKRRLHLIAEAGRTTQRGGAYHTAELLRGIQFDFDELEEEDNDVDRHLRHH